MEQNPTFLFALSILFEIIHCPVGYKLSYFSDHDHWTSISPNPPYPCSVKPPKATWTYQRTTGHLLQYDPSYDDHSMQKVLHYLFSKFLGNTL